MNPDPVKVFPLQLEAAAVLRNNTNSDYDIWSYPDANFGNVLLGDGYFAYNDTSAIHCTFTPGTDCVPDGVPDSTGKMTDMWISLPHAGWNLIGWPYNTPATIDQDTGAPIQFTNGSEVKSWADAITAGWLPGDSMQSYESSWNYTGFNYSYDDQLTPGKGYYIYTNVDNLAMIITAPATAQ